jgi:pilus assembly protein Flp/PilA
MLLSSKFQKGQGLVEYALILVLVVVVVLFVLTLLGPGVANAYSNVIDVV